MEQEKNRGKDEGSVGMRTRVGGKRLAVCRQRRGGGGGHRQRQQRPRQQHGLIGGEREWLAACSLALAFPPAAPPPLPTSPSASSRSREPLAFAHAYAVASFIGYLG